MISAASNQESETEAATQLPSPFNTLAPALQGRIANLPARGLVKLLTPPARGEGHVQLFRDACLMHRRGFSEADQQEVLRARYADFYREIEEREYAEAIANAAADSGLQRAPRKPPANERSIMNALSNRVTLHELGAKSPMQTAEHISTSEIIDRLFHDDDILCLGWTKNRWHTAPRPEFRGREHQLQFIVPNPMRKLAGTTRSGRQSTRCNDNVGPTRHCVVEFDRGTLDEQATLLSAIARCDVTLRMVVFSGGRSLHGWFDVRDWPAGRLEKLQRYAAALGADPATFTLCQFVRTPNARRDNGALQRVIYFS